MRRFRRVSSRNLLFVGCFALLFISLVSTSIAETERLPPFKYSAEPSETLRNIAERFHLDPEEIEDLNPTVWSRPTETLLVSRPRNAEEAVLLLEEAKRVEMLGGVGVRKATLLYRGLLEAAKLIPAESDPIEIVEMPSEVVAQALLGWGKIHETTDLTQAQWAYRQVRIYFPDKEEYFETSTQRLAQLESPAAAPVFPAPSTGLEWFPFSPHVLIDIDTDRLAESLREMELTEVFAAIGDHSDERIRDRYERGKERFEEILSVLSHLETIHIGGWVDPSIYGQDPEEGIRQSRWLIVGDLSSPFETFSSSVDLPSAETQVDGFTLHDIGDGSYLASDGNHLLVGKKHILNRVIEGGPPFAHPRLSSPQSGYQQARMETGAGATLFGYLDIENFLMGPALSFARNGDLGDEESIFISLFLSGLLGIHSIQGLAVSLDNEGGALSLRACLRHGKGGLLTLFAGAPCPSRTMRYFTQETHGFLRVLRPCTPSVEGLFNFRMESLLGLAAPIYRAHYDRFLDSIEEEAGARIDPARVFVSGLLSEVSVGLEMPGGMVPFPNLLIAAPTTLASPEIQRMESVIDPDGETVFSEEEIEGHWVRHTLIPIESPLFLNLSYTIHEGTFLVANNPDLIARALRSWNEGEGLQTDSEYREFSEEWFPSNHLVLYLSRTLTNRLARLGRVLVSKEIESPKTEPFARIFQSEMDRLVEGAHYSGLGLRLGEHGLHAQIRIHPYRAWLGSLLTLRWMKRVEQWNPED